MRECVKNWEDTTPGTVRGKPAHSQLQHSLHPRKRGGWARRSDGRFVTNRMKRLQGMAIAICHENGIPVRIISLDEERGAFSCTSCISWFKLQSAFALAAKI